jgi:glycosyltransferase involved in cell wall biosynthesis
MLLSLGHEVILYGAEGSDAPCTEFVQTHTMADIRKEWGDGDNRPECDGLGYDWRSLGFRHDFNAERTATTVKYYNNTAGAINERKQDDDFLLVMQGVYQKPISDAVKLWLTCEPGIGYRGSFARFRAFESAYLQNFTYGSENPGQCINGNYYDRVIPNYFDAKDFPLDTGTDGYFLYIGRLIERKGIWTAIKTVEAIDGHLIIAGQGELQIDSPNVEIIGYVNPEDRARLMGRAKAVFVPTLYLEAFGGVNVEAQLCGTPVITTNFGVFPETVKQGITGFCCDTLQDFVNAARKVDALDPYIIREHAERYLMRNVRYEFGKWFNDLYQLRLSAMQPNTLGWHHLEV